MKRILLALSASATAVVLTASAALAQYPPTSAPPGGGPGGPLPGGEPGGTLPFTGANISWGLILLGGLVITGAVLLFAARRRSRV
jgi:LPXTG-motif cell wall-anchored protein